MPRANHELVLKIMSLNEHKKAADVSAAFVSD
jgi:hypothetical protein